VAPNVLIVSAGMGAGHHAVSAELARRLTRAGAACTVVDILALAGPAGTRLRHTYRALLDHAPWAYGGAMAFWARWPAPMEALTARGARTFDTALAAAVEAGRPDVVVSTFNLASQSLGRLSARGAVHCPLATLVIDAGPHPYWVSRAVDRHLVPSALTAATLERYGARGLLVVSPLVRPRFAAAPSRAAARRRLGLPELGRVVLFTGGSWGVGGLHRSLDAIAGIDALTAVALCGRDDRLRARLAATHRVRAVGWTDAMPSYLAAADVVIDNAGGQTCWEALACGTPVVLFRPLAGHGVINARTLAALGWARFARTPGELRAAVVGEPGVVRAASGPFDGADPVTAVLDLVGCRHHAGRGDVRP
jgi:UDP-N-acetylglucosamine:LPS N-acetylglucosamine transferase